MKRPTISEFMAAGPHSIGLDRPLIEAHHLMRDNNIRHLPVLARGRLVGMVSERDLHLIETLRDVNPERVTVEEAMSSDPYSVPPDALLEEVALHLWRHKLGSAVVLENNKVVGVFTTTDALGALATTLARQRRPAARQKAPAPQKAKAKVRTVTRKPERVAPAKKPRSVSPKAKGKASAPARVRAQPKTGTPRPKRKLASRSR